MKRLLFIFSLAATIGVVDARTPSEMEDTTPIIVIQNDDNDNNTRGPVVVPINGYVDSTAGVVVLNFIQSCGMIRVSFNNLSDGSYYSTSVNGTGAVVIPLTLTSGSWTVTFELSNGTVYNGVFTI